MYSGTTWVLVGPPGTTLTGATADTVVDTTGTSQPVVKFIINNTIVAYSSATEFTPASAITGFSTIKVGITLNSDISNNKFNGTATDSDALGGVTLHYLVHSLRLQALLL